MRWAAGGLWAGCGAAKLLLLLYHPHYRCYHASQIKNKAYILYIQKQMKMDWDLTPEVIDFIAGSVAGAVSVAVGQPFDTVKVNETMPLQLTYL